MHSHDLTFENQLMHIPHLSEITFFMKDYCISLHDPPLGPVNPGAPGIDGPFSPLNPLNPGNP